MKSPSNSRRERELEMSNLCRYGVGRKEHL